MTKVVEAIGLVLAFEGLVFALAPRRLEEALMMLARLPVELRRGLGLGALALGVTFLALARYLGG